MPLETLIHQTMVLDGVKNVTNQRTNGRTDKAILGAGLHLMSLRLFHVHKSSSFNVEHYLDYQSLEKVYYDKFLYWLRDEKSCSREYYKFGKRTSLGFSYYCFLSFIVKCYIADNNIADSNLHQPASN